MGRAIFDMTASEPAGRMFGLLGLSEALVWAPDAASVFAALAEFAACEQLGDVLVELRQPSAPALRWTNAEESRVRAFDRSGAIQLIDDLLPTPAKSMAMAWSAQNAPDLIRIGDAMTREGLLRAQVGGGIVVTMALPSGRIAAVHVLTAPGGMPRIDGHARDTFLLAAIQAVLALDRCLGALPPSALTAREYEALRFSARGMGAREIAGMMNISEPTVKFHLAGARRKLKAKTTKEAVALLTENRVLNAKQK